MVSPFKPASAVVGASGASQDFRDAWFVPEGQVRPQPAASGGMDTWFLDRIFGRR